jgi:antitoxin component YwqK of YwqJK toxin-antitoxin module
MIKFTTKYNVLFLSWLIIVISLHASCAAQKVVNIHLKKLKVDISETYKAKYDFTPTVLSDTAFILIKYRGDMGIIHSVEHRLKDSLPDGMYRVYIDGILSRQAHYKNRLKENLWIEYNDAGERKETMYKNGAIKGTIREFYSNNKLKRISRFKNSSIKSRTTYFKSGKVKMKEFFENGKCIQIKKYHKDGKLEAKRRFTFLTNPEEGEEECMDSFYEENVIPGFKFEKIDQKTFSKSYLSDTLFIGFSESMITINSERNYLEFAASENLSPANELNVKASNTFRFFKYTNDTYGLAYAELNFPASYYTHGYEDKDVFKIVKDSILIDIGLSKQDFATLFNADTKALCDTFKIGDDASDSWYLFRNDKLHKIILTPYTN